jgi:hypothetical protein
MNAAEAGSFLNADRTLRATKLARVAYQPVGERSGV